MCFPFDSRNPAVRNILGRIFVQVSKDAYIKFFF